MDRTVISNVKRINMAYDSLAERLDSAISLLKEENAVLTKENVYYRQVSVGSIILSFVLDLIFLALVNLAFLENYVNFDPKLTDGFQTGLFDKSNILSSLILLLMAFAFLYCLYQTGIKIYCKKLEGYEKKIDKVVREISSNISVIRNGQLREDIIRAAAQNEEYTAPTKNNFGNELAKIRSEFINTNQLAHKVNMYVNIGGSSVSYIILILYLLIGVKNNMVINAKNGMSVMILFLLAAGIINITQFCAGEYMGNYSKYIGVAMAVMYGLILMITLKGALSFPAFELSVSGLMNVINTAYITIPIIQVLAIVLTIIFSRYELERKMWRDGFSVLMPDGTEHNGNKSTLLWRGGVATLLSVYMCSSCADDKVGGFFGVVIVATLWYASNTILKLGGSYLYKFWGRGRAIANEFVMASMLLTTIVCSRGTIGKDELPMLCVSLGVSFIIAAIVFVVKLRSGSI